MLNDLLLIEMGLKGLSGIIVLCFPRTLSRLLGLPSVVETFWPRLVGALLAGLAAATFLEGRLAAKNGLGLAGHVAINLAIAMTLVALLIMGRAGATRRGRAFVVLAAGALSVLALVELAWA
ncbi:MAG: hypothetical protein R3D44_14295 [Hyphomicrobiaceae bacterium]